VIMIIAVLMALLLPAVSSVREAARKAGCANNLKQFGIGMLNYETAFHAFPPAGTGFHGFTFWSLITNYVDDSAAAAFGSKLHLGHPARKISTVNGLPSVLDAETIAVSDQNEQLLIRMPQFPFLNCPTRGPRGRRAPNPIFRLNSDYVMVVSGPRMDNRKPDKFGDALCVTPELDGKSGCHLYSSVAGHGILNFALGRTRVTAEQQTQIPFSRGRLYRNNYTNMIDFYEVVVSNPSSIPEHLRVQRPYDGWVSRVRTDSVPDGLSMTAVLAEKHLSARELGRIDGLWRRPGGGLDSIKLAGEPEYRDMGHFTRGIAFGPSDETSPYAGYGNGPTVGSWHPGNEVNVLMADGSVRSIGSDIDTIFMLPMLGTRNDTEIRTDGRVLALP
jgi:prepilin-type processing-associated H-X9-DG protein